MLEDGFKSEKYSAILENLKSNGFLNDQDIEILLNEFFNSQKITLCGISDKKAKIVYEALIDNYNRQKSK